MSTASEQQAIVFEAFRMQRFATLFLGCGRFGNTARACRHRNCRCTNQIGWEQFEIPKHNSLRGQVLRSVTHIAGLEEALASFVRHSAVRLHVGEFAGEKTPNSGASMLMVADKSLG